jgi:TPR repeat protein
VPKLLGEGAKQTPHVVSNLVGTSPILNVTSPKKATASLSQAEKHYRNGRDLMLGLNGKKVHRVRAEEELALAAKDNHPMAIVSLARCYKDPDNYSMAVSKAKQMREQALKAGLADRVRDGDPEALVEWGHIVLLSRVKTDDRKAIYESFKKAADLGSLEGLFMVGVCHGVGANLGAEKNPDKALLYVDDAARKGLASAQYWLGSAYVGDKTKPFVKLDEKKAFGYFKAAADQNHPEALFALAGYYLFYPEKAGTKKNEKHAVSLLHLAAEQRQKWAPHTLGQCYLEGRGVNKNYKEAVQLLLQAERQGVDAAVLELGKIYATGGFGVTKDEKKAIEYLEKASKLKGHDRAIKEAKELLAKLKK